MKFLRDFLFLLVVVGCASCGVRYLHQKDGGGRLICDPARLAEGEVCLQKVIEDWKGDVLWVDARSENEWEKRTVPGSLCLNPAADPMRWDALVAAAMPKLMQASAEGRPIVVFCQSVSCGASERVAKRLRDPREYALPGEVYVLFNGWQAIQRYPYAELTE